MTLLEKQQKFSLCVGLLIVELCRRGYAITFGEAYRTPEQAAWYAAQGKGIKDSLHIDRLAIDLNLFRDKKYLTDVKDYAEAGQIWEAFSHSGFDCYWGGRFKDANHFSVGHFGKK